MLAGVSDNPRRLSSATRAARSSSMSPSGCARLTASTAPVPACPGVSYAGPDAVGALLCRAPTSTLAPQSAWDVLEIVLAGRTCLRYWSSHSSSSGGLTRPRRKPDRAANRPRIAGSGAPPTSPLAPRWRRSVVRVRHAEPSIWRRRLRSLLAVRHPRSAPPTYRHSGDGSTRFEGEYPGQCRSARLLTAESSVQMIPPQC